MSEAREPHDDLGVGEAAAQAAVEGEDDQDFAVDVAEPEDDLTVATAVSRNPLDVELDTFLDELRAGMKPTVHQMLTQRKSPFEPPVAPQAAVVDGQVDSIILRLKPTLTHKLGVQWCGLKISPKLLRSAVLRLVQARGHLLLEHKGTREEWLASASAEFYQFATRYPSFCGNVESCKYFLQNIWDSYSGQQAITMRQSRQRARDVADTLRDIRDYLTQTPRASGPRASPDAAAPHASAIPLPGKTQYLPIIPPAPAASKKAPTKTLLIPTATLPPPAKKKREE